MTAERGTQYLFLTPEMVIAKVMRERECAFALQAHVHNLFMASGQRCDDPTKFRVEIVYKNCPAPLNANLPECEHYVDLGIQERFNLPYCTEAWCNQAGREKVLVYFKFTIPAEHVAAYMRGN